MSVALPCSMSTYHLNDINMVSRHGLLELITCECHNNVVCNSLQYKDTILKQLHVTPICFLLYSKCGKEQLKQVTCI